MKRHKWNMRSRKSGDLVILRAAVEPLTGAAPTGFHLGQIEAPVAMATDLFRSIPF